ncbi:hypothetical protein JRO89_XS10G0015800 [Xanthoceras sorbifolium]|uniref:DUF7477 domain-containing protein n=1 Tax=Xanthoceras sorbifolium TaxID=99658 RepID=A0ABQ8HHE2_9ROSI|nr:hypothetical protein JRO89_XS10G0015800 [Xanthoceras sorbifolium]
MVLLCFTRLQLIVALLVDLESVDGSPDASDVYADEQAGTGDKLDLSLTHININKKWREGFHVTSMATAGSRWGVVMSRNAGFSQQVVELDFLYPSEGIHRRWDGGFRITSIAATCDQAALILRRKPGDETQETLRTSQFPSILVKVNTFIYTSLVILLGILTEFPNLRR